MKFLCGSCRTKYQISDEKVRNKILTIRCKKCGEKVVVKESLARTGSVAVAPVAELAKAQEARRQSVAKVAGASTLASAFDVAMTDVGDDMPTCIGPTPSNEQDAGIEWYSAIDGAQHGPFAFAEIVRQVRAGELAPRNYVWHDGMGPWQRVRECEDLKAHVPREEPKNSRPPPPPPAETVPAVAQVVDFAAEKERRSAKRKDEPEPASAEIDTAPPAPMAREAELEQVIGEVLGATAPPPEDALGLSAPAGAQPDPIAAAFTVGEPDDIDPDKLFDSVPRASEKDLVQRESTRFFVKAAGVNKQRSRSRILAAVLGVAGAGLIVFFAFVATGRLTVEIPGIGNPFAFAAPPKAEGPRRAEEPSEEERRKIEKRLLGARDEPEVAAEKKPVAVARRTVARPEGEEYLDVPEVEEPAATGPRGDEVERVTIGSLSGGVQIEKPVISPTGPEGTAPDLPVQETGRLDESTIRQVVNQNKSSVSICYQRELKSNSDVNGKIEFLVTVEPTGIVSRSNVRTAKFKGTALATCIADKIGGWRFPPFEGLARQVVVPFVLQRQSY